LYVTGYGGDLHVTIYEADGSQSTFTVPYASVVQLLRPGVWRYTAVAGEVQQPSLAGTERFAQATLQHGFNNYLTGYGGAIGAEHYVAGLLGIAVNTAMGAVALDVTEARAAALADTHSSSGQSLRLSFSKLVPGPTRTLYSPRTAIPPAAITRSATRRRLHRPQARNPVPTLWVARAVNGWSTSTRPCRVAGATSTCLPRYATTGSPRERRCSIRAATPITSASG